MTLLLRPTITSHVPIEVEGITPDALAGKSLQEIRRWDVFHGNQRLPLAELFDVSGDAGDQHLRWEGDLAGVHWIGAKMTSGRIDVEGSAGRHVGSEMRGGEIHVQGDAGDWLGGEMHRGLIHVRGRAGHLVGAAYRGSARGMTGGTILVHGQAGNEIGHTMRRGLIAIGQDLGDLVGFNMLAGTVLAFGPGGIRHGAGMHRGSLIFCHGQPPEVLLSFRHACRFQPPVLRILLRYLASHGFPFEPALMDAPFELYQGDMIEGGRGELLVRAH